MSLTNVYVYIVAIVSVAFFNATATFGQEDPEVRSKRVWEDKSQPMSKRLEAVMEYFDIQLINHLNASAAQEVFQEVEKVTGDQPNEEARFYRHFMKARLFDKKAMVVECLAEI